MDELIELVHMNGCDKTAFFQLVHETMLLFVLEEVCQKLKSDASLRDRIRADYRKTNNKTKISLRLVKEVCGTKLSEKDGETINNWLLAFFRKSGMRNPVLTAEKEKLLLQQKNRCACCNKQISLSEGHYDHIIPWDFVGDELKDNYQILCSYCNEHKSNNVHYMLKRQIIINNT